MTQKQWEAFCEFRKEMKSLCDRWSVLAPELFPLQKAAADAGETPEYPLETAVVYNRAYDEITRDDEIKLIVIGDNPGKEEQLAVNNKYLVGQSGRIAQGFFSRNPELQTDFRKNAIIINKTPVHTAKTNQIKYLLKNGSPEITNIIEESQKEMARLAAALQQNLGCQLWLVGYAELKPKGIFSLYRDTLKAQYTAKDGSMKKDWDNVYVFQHFSMNRFLIDLKEFRTKNPSISLSMAIQSLGHLHRDEIF